MRNVLINMALVLTSTVCCLATVEIGLRYWAPQYRLAAESTFAADEYRIWRAPANAIGWQYRPDTKRPHWVIHNAQAMRQHRNHDLQRLAHSRTIAFFGDSFIENRRLPIQHCVHEIVDYLLNAVRNEFTVLNFGVEGYGPDQQYIQYAHSELAQQAEVVLYFFCQNDVRNVYENDIFSLSLTGALQQSPARCSALLTRIAARLYTTYFVLDMLARATPDAGWHIFDRDLVRRNFQRTWRDWNHIYHWNTDEALTIGNYMDCSRGDERIANAIHLFRAIIAQWRQAVVERGSTFSVVLLPTNAAGHGAALFDDDEKLLNLWQEFEELAGPQPEIHWTFLDDEHWNEKANLLAARLVFRHLETRLSLPRQSDEWLAKQLYRWYRAFPDGWQPKQWIQECVVDDEATLAIRRKYLALEPAGPPHGEQGTSPDAEIRGRVPRPERQ